MIQHIWHYIEYNTISQCRLLQRKKDDDDVPCASKTQSKEAKVDLIFSELKKKHHEIYKVPKLRLWARMIVGGLHNNIDKPPDIPVFHCGEPKKRKESIAGAITEQ